jgi:IclR family acetate operon transcriptional repressor
MSLLEALAEAPAGMPLAELAQRCGLATSTAHRLLNTLARHQFVQQDDALGRWVVGSGAFRVGSRFLSDRNVVTQSRPFLKRLMEATGETANLAVLSGLDVVYVAQEPSRELMRMVADLGSSIPAHASAAGKAMLAALPEATLRQLMAGYRPAALTEHSITDRKALARELEGVRKSGYAADREEHAIGLHCVGATLYDEHGQPLAALSLSGPKSRVPARRIPELGRLVRDLAAEFSEALGGRVPGD